MGVLELEKSCDRSWELHELRATGLGPCESWRWGDMLNMVTAVEAYQLIDLRYQSQWSTFSEQTGTLSTDRRIGDARSNKKEVGGNQSRWRGSRRMC